MDAVEDIKSRLAIEDVVGEYVQLKRAGRNFKGLSPFTAERTPSFMVSPEKGIWHDFSSGKGGSMFTFIMEMEGLDFKGALELLARKAGIDLAQYQNTGSKQATQQKERLYEVLDLAARFYQEQFKNSQEALNYIFKQRQFAKDIVLAFRLGYSPNTGSALHDFLLKRGFTVKEMQLAGLLARRYRGGVQDMFRGRIMIPLMDQQGRVIGFTARLLQDDPNAPKYINTPQTLLYDKGRHVFGLHLAKEAIRKTGYVVLVEGNLDVIASHQAGVRNVVATAGTALTEPHLKTINRFTADVRLAFDQDSAGQAAAERAIPIASKVGVSLHIVTIPSGKDPDELIRQDVSLWQRAIDAHDYALDWLIARYQAILDLNSAAGKRQFSDVLLAVVRGLNDEVEQDHYLGKIADIIGVGKDALQAKMRGIKTITTARKRSVALEAIESSHADAIKTQNQFLCLMLMRPSLRNFMQNVLPEMFLSPDGAELFNFLLEHQNFDGQDKEQAEKLKNLADYVKMLALQYETLYQDQDEQELGYEAARHRVRLVERYVKTKKTDLVQAMRSANESETTTLLEQAKKLDELLKLTKG